MKFKLLKLGKEPKSGLNFPPVKRLKDKSRTSNCGRPQKSLSLTDSWLLCLMRFCATNLKYDFVNHIHESYKRD